MLYPLLVFIIVSLSETSLFLLIEGTPALPFLSSLLFSFACSIPKDRLPDYILKIAPSAAWMGNYLGKGKWSQSVQNSCLMFLKYDLYKEYSSLRKINYNVSSLLCREPGWDCIERRACLAWENILAKPKKQLGAAQRFWISNLTLIS